MYRPKEFLKMNGISEDDPACGYTLSVQHLSDLLEDYNATQKGKKKTDLNKDHEQSIILRREY